MKKLLFIKYYFRTYIEGHSYLKGEEVLVEQLFYDVFRLKKDSTGKYVQRKSYKGTGNVAYLARLFRMSDLFKEELKAFTRDIMVPSMMTKYEQGLKRYLVQISQRSNHLYDS